MLPRFRHLLLATDLSESATNAMRTALSLAHTFDARLTVLHVLPDLAAELSQRAGMDLRVSMSEGSSMDWLDKQQQATVTSVEAQVAALCQDALKREAVTARLEVLVKTGDPVETILDTAHDGPFDMIVVGTQGHDMVSRLLVGSVAEGVVRGSRLPVLVSPEQDGEAEAS